MSSFFTDVAAVSASIAVICAVISLVSAFYRRPLKPKITLRPCVSIGGPIIRQSHVFDVSSNDEWHLHSIRVKRGVGKEIKNPVSELKSVGTKLDWKKVIVLDAPCRSFGFCLRGEVDGRVRFKVTVVDNGQPSRRRRVFLETTCVRKESVQDGLLGVP